MVQFLDNNNEFVAKIIVCIVCLVIVVVSSVQTYKKYKSIMRIKRNVGKVSIGDKLELVDIICDIIIYSAGAICILTENMVILWTAVVIGILLNCVVFLCYKKYNH